MRKIIAIASTVIVLGASSAIAATFSDTAGHWAAATIDWGVQNHFISGYPDGTFKPDAQVTEAEFLTMLERAYTELPSVENKRHWADPAYQLAYEMNYPTEGAIRLEKRDWPITREHVAEIVAGTQGANYSGNNAIQFLLGKGLAVGNDPNNVTIESYNGQGMLTRAEAVQFIRNVKEKGVQELQKRPLEPSDPKLLPPLPQPKEPPKQETNNQPPANAPDYVKREWVSDWKPGKYTILGKAFFPTMKDNGDTVTVTIPKIEGYTVHSSILGYGENHRNAKPGETVTVPKGEGAYVDVGINPVTDPNVVESYTVTLDGSNIVYVSKIENGKMIDDYTTLDVVLEGLGL